MELTVPIWVMQEFISKKEKDIVRKRNVKEEMIVNVKEVEKVDFPLCFIVKKWCRVKKGKERKQLSFEIRMHNGKLYQEVRKQNGFLSYEDKFDKPNVCISKVAEKYTKTDCENDRFYKNNCEVINTNREKMENLIHKIIQKYRIYDEKVWEECGEPYYSLHTIDINGEQSSYVTVFYGTGGILKREDFPANQKEDLEKYCEKKKAKIVELDKIEILRSDCVKQRKL